MYWRISPRNSRAFAAWLLLGVLSVAASLAEREPLERGLPLIRSVVPDHDAAGIQHFGIAADRRGLLYVANLGGLLVYDGAWWQVLEIGTAKSAFAVVADANGRVAVGGVGEIGYLERRPNGQLAYVSLVDRLLSEQRDFSQVHGVFSTPDGFAFLTERWLVAWDGAEFATLATFPAGPPYARAFAVGDEIYVWRREGIARATSTGLAPVEGGDAFRDRRVDMILPAPGGLLVSVRQEGLFLLRFGQSEPFAAAASPWFHEHRVFSGCLLPDGRWALGSILGGLLLLRSDGQVDQVIDTTVGLPEDFVNEMAVDHEGGLWLALDNYLVRLEIASPLSLLDRRSGLAGSVYHVARHAGALWVATAAGLFTSAATGGGPTDATAWSETSRLSAVPGIPPAAWNLLPVGDDLLVSSVLGVHVLRNGGPAERVPGVEERTAYVLAPSPSDPGRVWTGVDDHLVALRRDDEGGWRAEGAAVDLSSPLRSIVESNGVVWCATELDGLIGVEWPAGTTEPSGQRRIATPGETYLYRIAGRLLVVAGNQILRLDERNNALVEDPTFSGLALPAKFSHLAEDADGNLWLNARPPAVFLRQGDGWAPEPLSLVEVPARGVEAIVAEKDGRGVWLATESGLFAYAGDLQARAIRLEAPLISRVTTGRDELLFAGSPDAPPPALELAPPVRRLRIAFAPRSFRRGLRYESRLDPVDEAWSAPAAESFVDLARLPAGDYTFRVRTRGPSGEASPETAWSFHVAPPWYRKPWALLLWLAVAVGLLSLYVRLRSRTLHRRAARLEARVAEQTVELRHTVDELRRTQGELEAANARLRDMTQQDELTGVANRRRLRAMFAEEWHRAERRGRAIAFILLDLDHFKLLNDTYGHQEGDRCLQEVAQFLDRALPRSGDLLVRYGGEEFAVLLPNTDLAGALQVAELLRDGIARLDLPHEASPEGRVTASLGVAALVPLAGQGPEVLIEAADLALYRAKAEGRNRVRGPAAETSGVSLRAN